MNLFVDSEAKVDLAGGPVTVAQQQTPIPDGAIAIHVTPERPRAFEVRVRIPGWAQDRPVPSSLYRYAGAPQGAFTLRVNGQPAAAKLVKGYAVIARTWSPGDVIALDLPMPVRRVLADDCVADDRGKVALERGPLVYCAEGADNGGTARDIAVPDGATFAVERRPDLLGGVNVLRAAVSSRDGRPRQLIAIPYYAWSNRGPAEMAVWFARKN